MSTRESALSAASDQADDTVEEPPFSPAIVEEVMKAFTKAMRAHQLYLPNNPMHQRALDTCRAAFAPLWEATGDVKFVVTETDMRWFGRPVLVEADKASDSLPWILYKDGVRELQLSRGFEDDELLRFLDLIQRVRRASPDQDDLITMLWEQDFSCLTYKYVEAALDSFTEITRNKFEPKQIEVVQQANAAAESVAPGIVSMSDFDSTLYFLDQSEISYLQTEVSREYEIDLRSNVSAMLLDIFELQKDKKIREEILDLLDYYLVHLLSTQSFSACSFLLRECAAAAGRSAELEPAHKERLENVSRRLSDPEALLQMLQALDDAQKLPPQEHLAELFSLLRGNTLEILLRWMSRLQNVSLKKLLEAAVERLAAGNTAELMRLINVEDRDVRVEAMRRAAELKSTAAVTPLTRAVSDSDPDIRLAATLALGTIASPGAMQALEKTVEDPSRDVRVAAVKALAGNSYRPCLPRVENAIKGRPIRDADLTEKMAFFEAFGTLAGEAAVPFLDGVLNGKGLFGKREDAEFRACAAMALGKIGSDRALSSLQKAAGEKDAVVRSAINRAFRGPAAS